MTPHTRCRLKLLKLERIKDYLLMEEEFIQNQERLKPQEEKQEVYITLKVYGVVYVVGFSKYGKTCDFNAKFSFNADS